MRGFIKGSRVACDPLDPRGTLPEAGRSVLTPAEKLVAFDAEVSAEEADLNLSDIEFQEAERETMIAAGQAKRICFESCPVRYACLSSSLIECESDARLFRSLDRAGGELCLDLIPPMAATVRGGWGPEARLKIDRARRAWRRRYREDARLLGHTPSSGAGIAKQDPDVIPWPDFVLDPIPEQLTLEQLLDIDRLASIIRD